MLKKIVMFLAVMSLMVGVATGFAAEKTDSKAAQTAKTEQNKYPHVDEEAILAARSEIPATAEYQGMLVDQETDMTKAFSFFDNRTLRAYEVTVLKGSNMVKTVKIGGSAIPGSTTVNKTVEDVKDIVSREYPDGEILVIKEMQKGNLSYYEAKVETQRFIAGLKINPVTGAIGSQVLEYKVGVPREAVKERPSPSEQLKPEKHNPVPSVPGEWMCGNCGTLNHEGQFCTNCGIQRPAIIKVPAVKCSKCGWVPGDSNNLPNFCPECGNRFEK